MNGKDGSLGSLRKAIQKREMFRELSIVNTLSISNTRKTGKEKLMVGPFDSLIFIIHYSGGY